jgi:glutamyl-tRNA synthetase
MSDRRVRVRFAPSPTGPLHMGGVRTALYNYLFAKKHNGDFLLRIEDTDQNRFVPGAEAYIIESLKWCGILPAEGVGFNEGPHAPYRQSERKEKGVYAQYAKQLIDSGNAYYAFDTSEELEAMRKKLEAAKAKHSSYNQVTRQHMKNSLTLPADEVQKRIESGEAYVVRMNIPRNEEIRLQDAIRGWVVVNSSELDDKVLFKSDGMPTYHLANVVDDYLMQITHVIRGEEWLPSAPLHVLLYRALGWENVMPQFAHLPLLLKPDGNGKLSKRDGDRLGFPVFPLEWKDPSSGEISSGYREKGYFNDAFINMLALLGWNPGENREIMSLEEMSTLFSLERVSKSGAKFDPEKAKWFNQQYLRKRTPAELAEAWMPELTAKGIKADKTLVEKVCVLLQEKAQFLHEFWSLGNYFFQEVEKYDEAVVSKKWDAKYRPFFEALIKNYEGISDFSSANAENGFKQTCEQTGFKTGEVMQLYRVALTGQGGGPALFEITALLGKENTITRINAFLKQMK